MNKIIVITGPTGVGKTEIARTLAYELSKRCHEEKIQGKTISISIRYSDFSTIVRSFTMEKPISKMDPILEHALYLFDMNHINGQPIRHLGIALGSLVDQNQSIEQISIFEPHSITNNDILDELNKNFDKPQLKFASDLLKNKC